MSLTTGYLARWAGPAPPSRARLRCRWRYTWTTPPVPNWSGRRPGWALGRPSSLTAWATRWSRPGFRPGVTSAGTSSRTAPTGTPFWAGWCRKALPEYAPGALRRARSPHFLDPDLQTAGELAARKAVEELDARHAEEKLKRSCVWSKHCAEAEGRAGPVRHALVYGTGAELVGAVAQVLTAAGLRSIDLDELGGTRSADLLVGTDGPPLCLVEVKATSGSATENLVNHLQRHLTTWPQLRPDQPVTGRSSSSTTSTGCTRPKEQPTSAPAPSSSPRCPLRSSALWRDTAAIQPPPGSAAPPARHWPGWADNGHHLAQDDGTVSGYRLGHQPGVAVQPLQGLHGGLVGAGPAEPGGDDLTLFGHRLLADDYQVTVGDRSPRSSSRR